MNKKNSGFSLVELIVVIAIMAVLVGVLAPAYLKYVEKSRKSADLDTIDSIIKAVDATVSDDENSDHWAGVTTLTITAPSAKIHLDVQGTTTATNSAALSDWLATANIKNDNTSLKSKLGKKGDLGITGTFNDTEGKVAWTLTANKNNSLLNDDSAKNFKNKIGIS